MVNTPRKADVKALVSTVAAVLLVYKVCSKCRVNKPLGDYYTKKTGKQGCTAQCKNCSKAARAQCLRCNKKPIFGSPEGPATHCQQHKEDDMIDVINTKCLGCKIKQPHYNLPGLKAKYCAGCRLDTMINVVHKTCAVQGCNTLPAYGITTKTYCSAHKTDGMTDLLNKRCNQCKKQANYGMPGSKPSCCGDHAEFGMIDVVNKRCSSCDKRATCGYPGVAKVSCAQHREKGMIFIKHLRCVIGGCNNNATHGIGYASHCKGCAIPGFINLVLQDCSNCGLSDILNQDKLCDDCNPNPKRQRLIKQNRFVASLTHHHPDLPQATFMDQYFKLDDEVKCYREHRPDLLYAFDRHVVILEVDEDGHVGYNPQCEIVRMMKISEYLKVPTIFIRYNPDTFKLNGIVQKVPELERVALAARYIDHFSKVDNVPVGVHVAHLFFDGYIGSDLHIVKEVRYDM